MHNDEANDRLAVAESQLASIAQLCFNHRNRVGDFATGTRDWELSLISLGAAVLMSESDIRTLLTGERDGQISQETHLGPRSLKELYAKRRIEG